MPGALLAASLCALTIAAETPAKDCDALVRRIRQRVDIALRTNPLKGLMFGTRVPWIAGGKVPPDRAPVLDVTASSVALDGEVMPGATPGERAMRAAKKLASARVQLTMAGRPVSRTLILAVVPGLPSTALFDVMNAFIGQELWFAGRLESPSWKDLMPPAASARDGTRAAWNTHAEVLSHAASRCPGLTQADASLTTLREPQQQERVSRALTALHQCDCALPDPPAFEHALPHILGFCGADLRVLPIRVQVTRGPIMKASETPTAQGFLKALEALPAPSEPGWSALEVRLDR